MLEKRVKANTCARCGELPAIHKDRLCRPCAWAIRIEITKGLADLDEFLARHAEAEQRSRDHGEKDA